MENFYDLIKGSKPVLVEFFADWCPHCQRMNPIVDELKKQSENKLIVEKCNINTPVNHSLINYYQVHAVPTFILFKGGEQVWRQSGEMQAGQLNNIMGRYL